MAQPAGEAPPPRVLIAGADDPLAEALCESLVDAEHQVRLTHEEPLDWVEEGGPWVQFFESRLQNEVATDVLLTTCSTLVIFPRSRGVAASPRDSWLDYDTRCIFNLLQSASCVAPMFADSVTPLAVRLSCSSLPRCKP